MKTDAKFGDLLFEKTVIGLALCKMNGDLVDVNTAYAKLLGRSVEETLSLNYWQITPKKYEPEEALRLNELKSKGHYGPYEKEYIHKDGHMVPVRLSGQLIEIEGQQYIWSSAEDITDRVKAEKQIKQLNKKLEALSFQDGLTGVFNRRKLDQDLSIEWNRAIRQRMPLTLIMIDIDFFKQYNDFYGHIKGDEALKQVAQALSHMTQRASEITCRYGGEEFVLLLPDTNQSQAQQIAQKILEAVQNLNIAHQKSTVSEVLTISVGSCTFVPTQAMQSSELFQCADQQLYLAKQSGRNQYQAKSENTVDNQAGLLNF
ncbi:MAG: GGDEF domain-containing protein [Thiotrichales bacterium]|nr:GGDEF domain-containing protein [Thiotrichales bacterium]